MFNAREFWTGQLRLGPFLLSVWVLLVVDEQAVFGR